MLFQLVWIIHRRLSNLRDLLLSPNIVPVSQIVGSTVTDTAETWWEWSAWRNTKTPPGPARARPHRTPGLRVTAGVRPPHTQQAHCFLPSDKKPQQENDSGLITLVFRVSCQVQRRRRSFSHRVMKQNTTRAPPSGGTTPTSRRCRTAPLRQTLECGRLRRTKGETTSTLFHTDFQTERWERGARTETRTGCHVRFIILFQTLSFLFQVNTLPQRSRGCSFLQEKMEELHLYKDKSREPDWELPFPHTWTKIWNFHHLSDSWNCLCPCRTDKIHLRTPEIKNGLLPVYFWNVFVLLVWLFGFKCWFFL